MGKCAVCGSESVTISANLGVCLGCIRRKPADALKITRQVHAKSRAAFGLPNEPPKNVDGLPCGVCVNNCVINVGDCGFCGLVWNVDGRLTRYGGTAEKGVLEWYYDSLPTNCVSWWFCPGCTGRAIQTTPINLRQNLDTPIWRFSTAPAATTAFTAKTGITEVYQRSASRL